MYILICSLSFCVCTLCMYGYTRDTYEWIMSHIWMSHVTHMNEPLKHMDVSYHTCAPATQSHISTCNTWVMSHTCTCDTLLNESCYTYEWVMSHMCTCDTACFACFNCAVLRARTFSTVFFFLKLHPTYQCAVEAGQTAAVSHMCLTFKKNKHYILEKTLLLSMTPS